MKNPKRPMLRQKKLISSHGLDPDDYLVASDEPCCMWVINKSTGKPRPILKGDLAYEI